MTSHCLPQKPHSLLSYKCIPLLHLPSSLHHSQPLVHGKEKTGVDSEIKDLFLKHLSPTNSCEDLWIFGYGRSVSVRTSSEIQGCITSKTQGARHRQETFKEHQHQLKTILTSPPVPLKPLQPFLSP